MENTQTRNNGKRLKISRLNMKGYVALWKITGKSMEIRQRRPPLRPQTGDFRYMFMHLRIGCRKKGIHEIDS